MDFDKLFPGRFLKAGQFGGRDVTMTIAKIVLEEMDGVKGKETKAIASFRERPLQLVLNKTNALSLKAMFGRETDQWVGKRVTFFPAKIQFEDHDIAIRVRGSPDIAANVTFELKLARKKPRSVTLLKTAVGQASTPATPPVETNHVELVDEEASPSDEIFS
jgi:hypothetical protein